MPEWDYRVDVQSRNGASESFDAKEFDIDISNIGLGAEAERQADHLIRFSYTGRSGEEVPLYPVPAQELMLSALYDDARQVNNPA